MVYLDIQTDISCVNQKRMILMCMYKYGDVTCRVYLDFSYSVVCSVSHKQDISVNVYIW